MEYSKKDVLPMRLDNTVPTPSLLKVPSIPVGETDSLDSVIAVINLVSSFKDNSKPATAHALNWFKVY